MSCVGYVEGLMNNLLLVITLETGWTGVSCVRCLGVVTCTFVVKRDIVLIAVKYVIYLSNTLSKRLYAIIAVL